ncbi:conjugal transfer protein TraJ, partial [Acinetobacter baumannii]
DIEQGRELVRVNGDLGRLGGLLKLWLTDDAKLEEMAPERMPVIIRGVLSKIEANQDELAGIIRQVLRSRQDFSG